MNDDDWTEPETLSGMLERGRGRGLRHALSEPGADTPVASSTQTAWTAVAQSIPTNSAVPATSRENATPCHGSDVTRRAGLITGWSLTGALRRISLLPVGSPYKDQERRCHRGLRRATGTGRLLLLAEFQREPSHEVPPKGWCPSNRRRDPGCGRGADRCGPPGTGSRGAVCHHRRIRPASPRSPGRSRSSVPHLRGCSGSCTRWPTAASTPGTACSVYGAGTRTREAIRPPTSSPGPVRLLACDDDALKLTP